MSTTKRQEQAYVALGWARRQGYITEFVRIGGKFRVRAGEQEWVLSSREVLAFREGLRLSMRSVATTA